MNDSLTESSALKVNGYLFAAFGVAVVTAAMAPFQQRLNSTTVALAFAVGVVCGGGQGARHTG